MNSNHLFFIILRKSILGETKKVLLEALEGIVKGLKEMVLVDMGVIIRK